MPRKISFWVSALVAMLMSVPAIAAPALVRARVTDIDITNLNRESMRESDINVGADFYLKVSWKATSEGITDGDWLELRLPERLRFKDGESTQMAVTAPDGSTMGTATVIPGDPSVVRITFNDWVTGRTDIHGTVWLAANFAKGDDSLVPSVTMTVTDVGSGDAKSMTVKTHRTEGLNGELIAKWAEVRDGRLSWKVRVNNAGETMHNVRLHDTIEGEATYIPGSFRIYRVVMDGKGNILDDPGWDDITADAPRAAVSSDRKSFDWDLSVLPHDEKHEYFVEYQTTYGKRVRNAITLTSDEHVATHEWTYIAANFGADGDGDDVKPVPNPDPNPNPNPNPGPTPGPTTDPKPNPGPSPTPNQKPTLKTPAKATASGVARGGTPASPGESAIPQMGDATPDHGIVAMAVVGFVCIVAAIIVRRRDR